MSLDKIVIRKLKYNVCSILDGNKVWLNNSKY
jgi:hypothetical protein